jgi:hypothetical protein
VCEQECDQKEADVHFLASEGGVEAVIISLEDTYVSCMDLAFCLAIEIPIYQKSRTDSLTQMVDIGKVVTIRGSSFSVALPRTKQGVDLSIHLQQ